MMSRDAMYIGDPATIQPDVMLEIRDDGVFYKFGGDPLVGGKNIMLYAGFYALPKHPEEDSDEDVQVMTWRIPIPSGHYKIIETLPRKPHSGWPYQ